MTRMRGIETWTAKMYLMFVLNHPDILPVEDGAFCRDTALHIKQMIASQLA